MILLYTTRTCSLLHWHGKVAIGYISGCGRGDAWTNQHDSANSKWSLRKWSTQHHNDCDDMSNDAPQSWYCMGRCQQSPPAWTAEGSGVPAVCPGSWMCTDRADSDASLETASILFYHGISDIDGPGLLGEELIHMQSCQRGGNNILVANDIDVEVILHQTLQHSCCSWATGCRFSW